MYKKRGHLPPFILKLQFFALNGQNEEVLWFILPIETFPGSKPFLIYQTLGAVQKPLDSRRGGGGLPQIESQPLIQTKRIYRWNEKIIRQLHINWIMNWKGQLRLYDLLSFKSSTKDLPPLLGQNTLLIISAGMFFIWCIWWIYWKLWDDLITSSICPFKAMNCISNITLLNPYSWLVQQRLCLEEK